MTNESNLSNASLEEIEARLSATMAEAREFNRWRGYEAISAHKRWIELGIDVGDDYKSYVDNMKPEELPKFYMMNAMSAVAFPFGGGASRMGYLFAAGMAIGSGLPFVDVHTMFSEHMRQVPVDLEDDFYEIIAAVAQLSEITDDNTTPDDLMEMLLAYKGLSKKQFIEEDREGFVRLVENVQKLRVSMKKRVEQDREDLKEYEAFVRSLPPFGEMAKRFNMHNRSGNGPMMMGLNELLAMFNDLNNEQESNPSEQKGA